MSVFELTVSALAAVALFSYALQSLSREIETTGGDKLKSVLARLTESPVQGFVLGLVITAIIQSSSAVSSFTVALVDAGVISLRSSFAVLLGANVGTTATAWLVSFKLAGIGAICVVIGTVVSLLPSRYAVAGRSIFYFGLILFALDLIGYALKPLRNDPTFQSMLTVAKTPIAGVLIGTLLTAIVQSSSVVVGLSVLFANEGVLSPAAVVPIVVGANLGSTTTALLASAAMKTNGRRAAIANFIFNGLGVLIVLPFLGPISTFFSEAVSDPGRAVAWAHLMFNVLVAVVGFAAIRPIERIVARVGPETV